MNKINIKINLITAFLFLLIILSCSKKENNNVEEQDDEEIIFNIILSEFDQNNNEILKLIDRKYNLYDFDDGSIRKYLESENVDDDLIEAFNKNRKNKEIITIQNNRIFQFLDDKSEMIDMKFPKQNNKNTSQKKEYILVEISNICFNENKDKAIVRLSVEYGTFPFSFVSTSNNYVIFKKEENWKEVARTSTWGGIS
jgi:hypothetical protein